MIPLGISYTASALTGNYLGEGKYDLAKRFALLTIILNTIIITIFIILMYIYSDKISKLFTHESEVVEIIKNTN
jgi:MATE family multidrug resistance protein